MLRPAWSGAGSAPVILLEEDCIDQTDDAVVVGKDPDDVCAALHLLVEPFQGVCNRYELDTRINPPL